LQAGYPTMVRYGVKPARNGISECQFVHVEVRSGQTSPCPTSLGLISARKREVRLQLRDDVEVAAYLPGSIYCGGPVYLSRREVLNNAGEGVILSVDAPSAPFCPEPNR